MPLPRPDLPAARATRGKGAGRLEPRASPGYGKRQKALPPRRTRTGMQGSRRFGQAIPKQAANRRMKPTDIRIDAVTFGYEDHRYRTPIKFGGTALDRVTLLNVECQVRTAAGASARGF